MAKIIDEGLNGLQSTASLSDLKDERPLVARDDSNTSPLPSGHLQPLFPSPQTVDPAAGPVETTDAGLVPDRNPFVMREARRLSRAYISRIGVLLYVVALGLYFLRLAAGGLRSVPEWVPLSVIGASIGVIAALTFLLRYRLRPWFSLIFTLGSAATLTFALIYYGPDNSLGGVYLLTLIVPMLFYPRTVALLSVCGVAVLSVLPYFLSSSASEAGLITQLTNFVPVYFVTTFCVNWVMNDMRVQWRESSKQRRLARDFSVIQELTTYIASTHDIQAICDTVVGHLSETFGYRYISIFLLKNGKLKLVSQRGYPRIPEEQNVQTGVMGRVVRSGIASLVPDADDDPDFVRADAQIRCGLSAPILQRVRGDAVSRMRAEPTLTTLGVINLEDRHVGALGEADLNLITTVAGALSVALDNAVLLQQWQDRGDRLELVNRVAHAVAAELDLPDLLKAACECMQGLVAADRATLSLIAEDGKYLEVAAVEGLEPLSLSPRGNMISLDRFQPQSVLQGDWLVLNDILANNPYPIYRRMQRAGIRSHIAIPLLLGERLVGLFALSATRPWAYGPDEILLLESITPHLATAVYNAQLYRSIKLRAETDNLTRLLNLPTFYLRLQELLVSSRASGIPLSVVMLDLDLFKSYNDSFGHLAGDSVLRQVASLLRQTLRHDDIAARYGGDEFAIIIPGLSAAEALDRVGQICATIGRTPFHPEDIEVSGESNNTAMRGVAILSASAGVASFPEDGTDAEHLVHLADTALYEAKRRGRNRACAYNASGPSVAQTNDNEARRAGRRDQLTDTDPAMDADEARESRASSNEYLHAVYALASAVELRDGYTHGHSERVAFYATRLGEVAGLPPEELSALRIAGLLHDIGKLSLPHEILHKPGRLTPEEWDLVRQHPVQGEGILRPLRNFSRVWPMVSCHHENHDGSGYPHGLKGEDIPVGGRILHIADAYEVMTVAGRSYQKRARSPQEAVDELRRCAGRMFDPHLVALFVEQVVGDPSRLPTTTLDTRHLTDALDGDGPGVGRSLTSGVLETGGSG